MRPVQDKLKAAGIPAEAIRTTAYDVQYEWDFVNNKRVGRGYVARNTIDVRIDAIDRVGEYLEIAASAGATALGGIRFDLKDQAKFEREALRLAVLDARAKADAAAAGAGRSIDRILRVEEQGVDVPPMPMRMMRQAAQAAVRRRHAADLGGADGNPRPRHGDRGAEVGAGGRWLAWLVAATGRSRSSVRSASAPGSSRLVTRIFAREVVAPTPVQS